MGTEQDSLIVGLIQLLGSKESYLAPLLPIPVFLLKRVHT